jgi:cytoskeletal protein CcmA (bactofilin family)
MTGHALECRRRVAAGLVVLALFAILPGALGLAQEVGGTVVKRGTIAEDLYVAGGRVDVLAVVAGDVVAAGGRVAIGERIGGDVLAAGGEVVIRGQMLDDVRAAGGLVTVAGDVAGDLTVVGASVVLPPETRVRGRVWVGGGELDLRGRIGGRLRAAGGTIRIGGEIDGDVDLAGRTIEILPTAHIRGEMTYRSLQPAVIAVGARIDGTVRHQTVDLPAIGRTARTVGRILGALLLGSFLVAGIALVLVFPGATLGAARTVRTDPWKSLGLGFALLVSSPVAVLVLAVTGVGLLLGLAVAALYGIWLIAGFLVGATFLGGAGTRLLRRPPSRGRTVLSLLAGLIVIGLLQMVPVAGPVVAALVLLLGLGASSVYAYRRHAGPEPSGAPPGEPAKPEP